MKYLVTGANGFLGKHICQHFEENGIDYRASVREKKTARQIQTGDLVDFKKWDDLFSGVDVVIHSAAKAHDMSGAPELKSIYTEVNLNLTKRLAEEAKNNHVKKFIFISTIKVNGEMTFDKPFTADDPPNPTDDYGQSKYLAERELLKLHQPGVFDVVIIRPCLIYGAGVKANFLNLIKLVDKSIPLPFGMINNKRSFVSVQNLIDLIKVTASHPAASGQIFLVSDGQDLSLPQLIRRIAAAKGRSVMLLPFPAGLFKFALTLLGKKDLAVRLMGNLQVDIEKTKNLLNWRPPYSVDQSLQSIFK